MFTRWRVLRILAVFLIAILLILYVAARLFILNSFVELERNIVNTQTAQVKGVLTDRLDALSSKTGDWATWDEAYDYMEGRYPAFASTEMTDATFAQLQVNLMMFVKPSGEIVYYQAFDLARQQQVPFDSTRQIRLDEFLRNLNPESRLSGLVLLPANPMLIAARPIMTSEGTGPIAGVLVFGRYLDTAEIEQLAATTHRTLSVQRLDQAMATEDLLAARAALSKTNPQWVQPLSEQTIAGYALLNDINAEPILVLRVVQSREVYQQGWTSIIYFLLALSAVVFIFAAVAYMLGDRLMQLQSKQRESEQLYYTLAEAAPDAIYVVAHNQKIKYANETATRDFGDRWEELVGTPNAPAPPDHPGKEIRAVLETLQPAQLERKLNIADQEAWFDIKMVPLRDESGEWNAVLGIARDITERKRAHAELALAYDTTLEAWTYALDLRVSASKGHARRTADLVVRLARTLGMRDEDVAHLQRGALLHDIGTLAIPDVVFLKPGPLTEEEWKLVRQHPVLAYEMLSPIPYLQRALDIPYYHHERWDGTGYPRGLKGEQIPFAARLFAIIDVWDALGSDRPFRRAWPRQQALAYLRDQRGKQFDPQAVEVFLRFIEQDSNGA